VVRDQAVVLVRAVLVRADRVLMDRTGAVQDGPPAVERKRGGPAATLAGAMTIDVRNGR